MNRHLNHSLGKRHGATGLWGFVIAVCTLLGMVGAAQAVTVLELRSRSNVSQESCLPANSAFDPGETNTVTFTFRNKYPNTDGILKEVKVTLLGGQGNVAFPVKDANAPDDGKVTLVSGGARFDVAGDVAKDADFTVTFRFRADGTCGDTLTPTFTVTAKDKNGTAITDSPTIIEPAKSKFLLGEVQTGTYGPYTSGAITITDFNADSAKLGRASAYPSTINIPSGVVPNAKTKTGERLSKVTVTLNNISHDYTRDIRALLVSPNGQKIMLMRSAGGQASGQTAISGINLTFDSVTSGLSGLPQNAQIAAAAYRPTDFGTGDLPSDAPAGAYTTDLTALHASRRDVDLNQTTVDAAVEALDPKGDWKLFVQDGTPGGTGSIAGGWSIRFETQKVVCCGAGVTFPTITQNSIPKVDTITIDEDVTFVTTDTSSSGGSKQNGGIAHVVAGNTVAAIPVTFNIRDIETTDNSVLFAGLSVVSGNQAIIQNSKINKHRDGGAVKLDFQPEANANGETPITVTLTDPSGNASSTSFTLKVTSRNDFPVFNTFPFNQSVNKGVSTDTLGFTISDVETDINSLIVSAVSQQTAVVPNAAQNIQLSGVGPNRAIKVVPADSNTDGQATIRVTITDGNGDTAFKDLVVSFAATAGSPTITPIGAISMNQDTSKQVEFEIRPGTGSTVATDSLALAVSVASVNPSALLTASNVQLSGSGTRRIATITPALNITGSAQITITVTDNTFSPARSSSTTFTLTVDPVNQAPTITAITDQTIDANKATGDLAFTITDRENSDVSGFLNYGLDAVNPAGRRVVATVVSQDPSDLLPNLAGSIVFTGTGASRTLKVTPKADRFGKALIKITVSDAGVSGASSTADEKSASTQFLLTVNFVNKAPSIGGVSGTGQNTDADTDVAGIAINTIASDATDFSGATFTVNENQAIVGNEKGRFGNGGSEINDDSKDVVERELTLTGISPGADSETDQTVTITATADDTNLIKSLSFATDANKVKLPANSTTLKYKLGKNVSGNAIVTLTLNDGNGGVTTRKFRITVRKINNTPSITLAGVPTSGTRLSNDNPQSISAIVTDRETSQQNMTVVTAVADSAGAALTAGNTPFPGGSTVATGNVTTDTSLRAITVTPDKDGAWGSASANDRPVKVTVTYTDKGATGSETAGVGRVLAQPKSVSANFTLTFADITPNSAPSIGLVNGVAGTDTATSVSLAPVQQDTVATASVAVSDTNLASTGVRLVAVSTSDANIVNLNNVLIGGTETAATRQVAIIPNSSVTGSVTIGLQARDAEGLVSAVKSLVINFYRPEGPPVITLQTSTADGTKWSGSGATLTLTVNEDVTPVPDPKTGSGFVEVKINGSSITSLDQLTVTGTATGTGSGIVNGFDIASTGALDSTGNQTRTVRIRLNSHLNSGGNADGTGGPPAATTCTINLKVTDTRSRETTTSFTLNVVPVNDAPTFDNIANQSITEDPNVSATAATLTTVNLAGLTTGGDSTEQTGQTMSLTVTVKDQGSDSNTLIDTSFAGGFLITPSNGTASTAGSPTAATGISSGGGARTATIAFRPNKNKWGTAVFTVVAEDNGNTANGGANKTTKTFNVVVNQFNVAPIFLSGVPDQTVTQATAGQTLTNTVSFGVKDGDVGAPGETPVDQLVVTAVSSNQGLIPNANISIGGLGSTRSVSVVPVTGQLGEATITVRVTDKGKSDLSDVKFTETTYKVSVQPKGTPDILGLITVDGVVTNRVNMEVNKSKLVTFRVDDTQTDPSLISVTLTADNTALFGSPIIVVGSDPKERQIVLRPGKDLAGTTVVTVTVTDRDTPTARSSTGTFVLSVSGFKPTISGLLADYTIQTNTPLTVNFTAKSTSPASDSLLLRVSASSSNADFIPSTSVVPQGSGESRSLVIVPGTNKGGSTTITVTVTDPGPNSSETATFVVHTPITANTAPTISSIANQIVDKGSNSSQLSFTIGDLETAVDSLIVTQSSSNTALVTVDNILLSSGGASRTVLIRPTTGQEGTSTITLTVTDRGTASGSPALSASTSFTVTVLANEAPTISSVTNQSTERNRATSSVTFTVGDKETSAASLSVTGTSSNTSLVSDSGITVGGSGAARTVVVTPNVDASGTATITLKVTDAGGKTASTSFTVTVTVPPAVKGDFDGDGQSDLLFQDPDGFLATWLLSGTSLSSAGFTLPSNVGDAAFKVAATGDFDRDGSEDIIFQHADGTLAIWFMSGTIQNSGALLNPSSSGDSRWRVVGASDMNKDGKTDLVFQHNDGSLAVWFMDGINLSSAALLSPASTGDAKWRVAGVGDITGDGKDDLLFQYSDGTLALWAMNGTSLTTASLLSPSNAGVGWRIAGTGRLSKALAVTMTGAGERPAVTTTASGSGKLTLVGNKLTFNITYSGLSGAATGAHIHLPASTEETAGVSINFQQFNGGAFGTSGSLVGSVTLTSDQLTAIAGGRAYVNIHTAANPGGEIRGQIGADSAAASKVDILFQHSSGELAVWFMDGNKLSSASLLTPSNSGATWKLVGPK